MVSFPGVLLRTATPRRWLHNLLEEEEKQMEGEAAAAVEEENAAEEEVEICDIATMSKTLRCLKGRCVGM